MGRTKEKQLKREDIGRAIDEDAAYSGESRGMQQYMNLVSAQMLLGTARGKIKIGPDKEEYIGEPALKELVKRTAEALSRIDYLFGNDKPKEIERLMNFELNSSNHKKLSEILNSMYTKLEKSEGVMGLTDWYKEKRRRSGLYLR